MFSPKHHKQKGYSLIELLVALSVIAIIILITVPVTYSLLEKKIEEKVLDTFQYDMLFLQNQSIAAGSEKYLGMKFNPSGYTIAGINNNFIVRELPKGWTIDPRNLKSISFNQNGAIRFAGKIEIQSPKNRFIITFPIGKGRGYIEKR